MTVLILDNESYHYVKFIFLYCFLFIFRTVILQTLNSLSMYDYKRSGQVESQVLGCAIFLSQLLEALPKMGYSEDRQFSITASVARALDSVSHLHVQLHEACLSGSDGCGETEV